MLYIEIIADCSENQIKYIHALWAECRIFILKLAAHILTTDLYMTTEQVNKVRKITKIRMN